MVSFQIIVNPFPLTQYNRCSETASLNILRIVITFRATLTSSDTFFLKTIPNKVWNSDFPCVLHV